MVKRLENKVAVITGASGGQGQLHAEIFISEGAKVVMTDMTEKGGKELAEKLGDNVIFLKHDISSEKEWKKVVQITEQTFGPINILVNNAGIAGNSIGKHLEDITIEDYNLVMNVNAAGTFLGMKTVIPSMKKTGQGSIINVSSIGGQFGTEGSMDYLTSKFAVTGMTKAAALDYARENIRVNSVHPGTIESPALSSHGAEKTVNMIKNKTPLQRLGKPEEVTKLILFLASNESGFCTGSEFVIDGGVTAQA